MPPNTNRLQRTSTRLGPAAKRRGLPSHAGARDRATPPDGSILTLLLPVAAFFAGTLLIMTLSRIGLLLWKIERVAMPGHVLLNGLRMDVLVLCMVTGPLILGTLALSGNHLIGREWRVLLRVILVAWTAFFLFMELATPNFIEEYDSRPNRLFIEYLGHPREVASMLLKEYPLQLLLTAACTALATRFAWRLFGRLLARPIRASPFSRVAAGFSLLPLVFLGARSSLQHRPANPSSVACTSDHLVNDLCLSSGYSLLFAIYRMRDEADAAAVYGHMPIAEAIREVRASMLTVAADDFTAADHPTLHIQHVRERPRPRNLVILLEESMGAQYSAALGGIGATPELDALGAEGWWFENMYATGTRSVRGIEAVITGFPPTPARAVVKLGKAQADFFTLGSFLKARGYHTQFVYGGESHFDNMRGFLSSNGFDQIIDQSDIDQPRFKGSWGVCDEDMFQKAHESFLAFGDEPFFSLVFSVSNHSPFEFPEDSIDLHGQPAGTRNSSVMYADHALGTFFELARAAPYWKDTVFLVVADHDSRVHGASLVPIEHFRIPALILGPDIEPRVDPRLASQLDLGPTLLSLVGVGGEHPMIGRDLTALAPGAPGRAIMQYGANQAYMEEDRVLILQPDLAPCQFLRAGGKLLPVPVEEPLARRALAHAVLASWLYSERAYGVPLSPERPVGEGP